MRERDSRAPAGEFKSVLEFSFNPGHHSVKLKPDVCIDFFCLKTLHSHLLWALAVLNCLFCTVGGTSCIHALLLLLMFSESDIIGVFVNIYNIAKAHEVQKQGLNKVKKERKLTTRK